MYTGKTSTEFEYAIDEEVMDDYELLEILTEIDGGNASLIGKMVRTFLGEEQAKALKEHCRVNGRVSAKQLLEEVGEIFMAINSAKNS